MMKRIGWIAAAGALIVMLTGCGANEGTPMLPSEPVATVESKVETTAPTEAITMPETEAVEISTEVMHETEEYVIQALSYYSRFREQQRARGEAR